MIEEFKIGSFKVDGKRYIGDIKIYKGKVHYWPDRYRQTLQMRDIAQILASKPEVLVIGSGCNGQLEIPKVLKETLTLQHIQTVIEKTPEACQTFNKLVKEQKNVAAIFHATG